jgi:hypothetical protein
MHRASVICCYKKLQNSLLFVMGKTISRLGQDEATTHFATQLDD